MTRIRFEYTPDGASQDSTWLDPRRLSWELVELAHRSHGALKAGTQLDIQGEASREDLAADLRDLAARVARLERQMHERRPKPLIPWVEALEQRLVPA